MLCKGTELLEGWGPAEQDGVCPLHPGPAELLQPPGPARMPGSHGHHRKLLRVGRCLLPAALTHNRLAPKGLKVARSALFLGKGAFHYCLWAERENRSLSGLCCSVTSSPSLFAMEVKFLAPPELAARVTFWLQTQGKAQGSSWKEAVHRASGSSSYEGQKKSKREKKDRKKRRKPGIMISTLFVSPLR